MLTISEDIASTGVMHHSIAIIGVSEKFHDKGSISDVVLDSIVQKPDFRRMNKDFRRGVRVFFSRCPAHVGDVLLDNTFLLSSLSRNVAKNARC